MPIGFGSSNRRRRSQSTYVAPPVQSPSYNFAQSAANHASGNGGLNRASSMSSLSGNAAAAALRKHQVSPLPSVPIASRTNSLSSRSFRPPMQQQRSNSLSLVNRGYGQPSFSRSNSLVSNTPGRKALDSDVVSTTVTTTRGKDPNTVIRTTRKLGADGRTKSLVKETITKMGSFEVVKTTVIKQPNHHNELFKPPSAPSAYYAGSLLSTGDSELENIVEEFDTDYRTQNSTIPALKEESEEDNLEESKPPINTAEETRGHTYRFLVQGNTNQLNNNNLILDHDAASKSEELSNSQFTTRNRKIKSRRRSNDEDSNSGDSVYSDAYDLLPSSNNKPARRSIIKHSNAETSNINSVPQRPRRGSNTSSTRKSVRIDAPTEEIRQTSPIISQEKFRRLSREQPKVELTPDEMYLKALEVARQKVYGDSAFSIPVEDEGYNSDSSFKRRYSTAPRENHGTLHSNNSILGGRTMSLNSANVGRTMSLTSGHSYEPHQQAGPAGLKFRNHSLRAQHNPMTPVDLQEQKKNRISSIIQRSPSQVRPPVGKVDKKLDKKQRKENLKLMEQQRKDAAVLASERADANLAHQQYQAPIHEPVVASSQSIQSDSSKAKKSSRFSIFGKKSKKVRNDVPEPSKEVLSTPIVNITDGGVTDVNNTMSTPQPSQKEAILPSYGTPELPVATERIEYTSPSVMENSSRRGDNGESSTLLEEAYPVPSISQYTPPLSLSNHLQDENSSEPRTLDQEELNPSSRLQYEDYSTIKDQVEAFKLQPLAVDAVNAVSDPIAEKKKKPKRKSNKSFGKKVLKWFDLDE